MPSLISDCWEWAGPLTRTGYGRSFEYGKTKDGYAHRFVYKTLVESIPEGMVVDHLCNNRACVNPWHLSPCTQQENIQRGWERTLPTCPRCGDEWKTYVYPQRTYRRCLRCEAANALRRRRARAAA